jgi:hypothetical protein
LRQAQIHEQTIRENQAIWHTPAKDQGYTADVTANQPRAFFTTVWWIEPQSEDRWMIG